MKRHLQFLISCLAALACAAGHADETVCQSRQLSAAAKLCNSLLYCEAELLKSGDKNTDAYNACVKRSKNAFVAAYRQAGVGGVCWLDEPGEAVLARWVDEINGAPLPLSDRVQSLNQLLRHGVGNKQASRDLHGALLQQGGVACKSALDAYAGYAADDDADILAANLQKSRGQWLQGSKKRIADAQAQGVIYEGKAADVIYDRIALLAEQRAQDTTVNNGRPQPTGTGMPEGESHSAIIGSKGGTISAGPGKVKLTFPKGALSQSTKITIQPLTNHIPGGKGLGYRFEPDGLQFAKPVTVTLPYDPKETQPANMGLGYQDDKGFWHGLKQQAKVYETDNTLSFDISHFSRWGFYEQWYLIPAFSEVSPGGELQLSAMYTECAASTSETDCLLTPLVGNADIKSWSVNGIEGGSKAVGSVTTKNGAGKNAEATYHAPLTVPKKNPVGISAVVDTHNPRLGQLQIVGAALIKSNWSGYIRYEYSDRFSDKNGSDVEENSISASATFPVTSMIVEIGNQVVLQLDKPTIELHASEYQRWQCGEYRRESVGKASDDDAYENYPVPALELHFEIIDDQSHKLVYTPTALFDEFGEWEKRSFCDPRGQEKGSDREIAQTLVGNLGYSPILAGKTGDNGHLQGRASFTADEGKITVSWDLVYQ